MRTDYEMTRTRSWSHNLPGQITSIRWRQYSATYPYITWATGPSLLLLERWTAATSQLRAQHSISIPPKIPSHIFIPLKPNMPTFFAVFLTSHYCNQINFPLRFHISHARPLAAALKWFASLTDVPEYSTRISDDDVVSNGKAHETNIFSFTDTSPYLRRPPWSGSHPSQTFLNIRLEYLMTMSCQMVTPMKQIFSISRIQAPTGTNKKPQKTEPPNTLTIILEYHKSSNQKVN